MVGGEFMKRVVSTLGLTKEEWLRYRKQGIGGSDAGAICGLNPYSSPVSVYLDKTNEEITEYDNEAMRQGRDLEEYVASRFCEETGKKVRRRNAIFCNEKHSFMYANIDRYVVGEEAGLECKTASAYSADKWKNGEVPMHYQIQCLHYMAVTGAKAWYLAVVILGKVFKYVKFDRDEEMIQNLITIEANFWNNHVLKQVMPVPDGSDAADRMIASLYSRAKEKQQILLNGYDEKIKRRFELDQLIDKLEVEKKQIEQEIKLAMADAEEAICEEFYITWKNMSTRKIDATRLQTECPEVYQRYLKESNSRRFTIKAA